MRIDRIFAFAALLSLSAFAAPSTYGEDLKMSNKAWKNHYLGRLICALPNHVEVAADYKIFGAKLELIN